MANKETALDWAIKQINNKSIGDGDYRTIIDIFKEAKQMEKEQILDACHHGVDYDKSPYKNAEEYYNKTYGKI